jgi:hypothetical protein
LGQRQPWRCTLEGIGWPYRFLFTEFVWGKIKPVENQIGLFEALESRIQNDVDHDMLQHLLDQQTQPIQLDV